MARGKHAAISEDQEEKTSRGKSVLSFLFMVLAVLLLSWGLRAFVVQPYQIPSGSMESTIMIGDYVFSEKISYRFSEPQQGDIVTFDDPDSSQQDRTLIKRVIATEGQVVSLENGVVFVDGVALSEPYTDAKPSYPLNSSRVSYPYTVPEGCVWVMGDNRTNSQDSRYFGAIEVSSISGKAVLTYWPLDHLGLFE